MLALYTAAQITDSNKGLPINKNDQDSAHHQFILFSHCVVFAAAAKADEKLPQQQLFRDLFSCAAALIFLPFLDLFIYLCTLESDALSNFFNPLYDI